ncbi:carbohydrate-binding module family 21 protein [Polychaeton citri CBS 116435]|uniref:Carbohydrate-binding module family 21 protein n=1 Tax=Polychaeton citri CBS 116435 TaxID=1314669 RepID=A0A9P4UQM2_9PEZI|nr:carbohydrate-binding module family 21 protein [Polychaeton citri CBS 116435]
MPYTPPAQSPSSSKSTTPSVSRTSSYSEHDVPRSPVTGRPHLPRSQSSSTYLHKQRRSPSFQRSEAPPTPTEVTETGQTTQAKDFASNGSLHQSPSPVNNYLIPTGAMISPPDSSENSGDEGGHPKRGRDLEKKWDALQEAVRGIDLKRESSPEKAGHHRPETSAKISHSRSSTENAIIIPRQTSFAESSTNSSDSDEDDPLHKPSLVRKKSGELVKPALRPSSRRRYSSMPGTPTYSKSVHFNDNDNQTRHFLQVDKPMAVSAGTSPVETYDNESEYPFDKKERQIRLPNFPADTLDRRVKPVRVERISLSTDKQTLIGTVAVQNISFHKLVVARFTFDWWKTTSEVVAEFHEDPRNTTNDGCDRFDFSIKLSDSTNVDDKTLLLCMRYNVNGQEFWDNNDGANYHIEFSQAVRKVSKPAPSGLGARPINAIPRSRHLPPSSRGARPEAIDDDFFARFDNSSSYSFGTSENFLGEGGSIKLKPRQKRGNLFAMDTAVPQPATNGLGGRYDFGASLSVALTNAQNNLGRRSGLMGNKAGQKHGESYFGPEERNGVAKASAPAELPDSISTDRPAMGSDQYRDLVQKFCYFKPTAGKTASPPSTPPQGGEEKEGVVVSTLEVKRDDDASSHASSGTNTPSPRYENNTQRFSPAVSPFLSRSSSPAPVTGQDLGARAASPLSFGYPYHGNRLNGLFSDSITPTAIHG